MLVVLEGLLGAMVIMNKDSPAAVPVLSAMMSDVSKPNTYNLKEDQTHCKKSEWYTTDF